MGSSKTSWQLMLQAVSSMTAVQGCMFFAKLEMYLVSHSRWLRSDQHRSLLSNLKSDRPPCAKTKGEELCALSLSTVSTQYAADLDVLGLQLCLLGTLCHPLFLIHLPHPYPLTLCHAPAPCLCQTPESELWAPHCALLHALVQSPHRLCSIQPQLAAMDP